MSLTDQQFRDWIAARRDRQPVVLVDIEAKDGEDNDVTLHLSTAKYFTETYPYRSRLTEFQIEWQTDPLTPGFTEIRAGDLEVLDPVGSLDTIRDLRMGQVSARLGDRRWDLTDFRSMLTGNVRSMESDRERHIIILRDKQDEADTVVEDIAIADALPGAMVKALLTTHGPFSVGDLDTDAFDQLDMDFPYTLELDGSDRHNLLDLIDSALNGIPVTYGPNRDGLITLYQFKQPTGTTTFRPVRPAADIEIERIPPLGEVTVRHGDTYESTIVDSDIQADHPDYRTESIEVAAKTEADGEAIGQALMDVFNRPFDRLNVPVKLPVFLFQPTDEIQVVYRRRGYQDGRYGVITGLLERSRALSELEVWV